LEVHHCVPHKLLPHATKAGQGALGWHVASGYLCFPAQDFILIICHAIIAVVTMAGGSRAPSAIASVASDEVKKNRLEDTTCGYSFQFYWVNTYY